MKILYSHYLNQSHHPAAQMVAQIAAQLEARGHDVVVHASARTTAEPVALQSSQDQVRPRRNWNAIRRTLWFAKAMGRNRHFHWRDKKALTDYRPDVVLARQDAYCWSMVRAAVCLGIPVVTYADAPVAYECRLFNEERRWHPPGVVEQIERWGLKQSRAIITVSEPARRRLERYATERPIHVIPNGVDPERFPERSCALKRRLRQELRLTAPVVIGFQGSFRAFHGIDRLRDIMLASASWPDVEWLLIGDGPERRPIENAVSGRVKARFLGRRDSNEMGRLLCAVDIAVAPHAQLNGDFYFCPLKILEYAASGCAVVASRQGDIPRLLADGTVGEIVSTDDEADWLRVLQRLITDSLRRQELGSAARRHVLANLTWAQTSGRVERVLKDAVRRPSIGRGSLVRNW